eukprot:Nk52_evm17s96 gene=Nk52_evmTU17s96
MNLVGAEWELLDPNPDIYSLFEEYNRLFFDGLLCGIEVKWSPRMTLCAGVCSFEGRGGLCSIRLSKPLLSLRPRKDLVETLLHEMIHAFLFVTEQIRDRRDGDDGHGPKFQFHMNRINRQAGTSITIYHSFKDEVNHYRNHIWQCSGPCRDLAPYFGKVRRAMNRAPSSRDHWFPQHERTCGGTFVKVSEPEDYGKKKRVKKAKGSRKEETKEEDRRGMQDIREMFKREVPKALPAAVKEGKCPLCGKSFSGYASEETLARSMNAHLDKCLLNGTEKSSGGLCGDEDSKFNKCWTISTSTTSPTAVGSSTQLSNKKAKVSHTVIVLDDDDGDVSKDAIASSSSRKDGGTDTAEIVDTWQCPKCLQHIPTLTINGHLDQCLL